MRAKWRKPIWAILAVQLLLLQLLFLNSDSLDWFCYRVIRHFGMPYLFYDRWRQLVLAAWLVPAGCIMAFHVRQYIKFRTDCIRKLEMITDETVKRALQEAAFESGLWSGKERENGSARTFLYSCNEIGEPFVIGFRRPILLLPKRVYDSSVLPFILLHECYHLRNRDTLYKLFFLLMQSLLWFWPLMYLLRAAGFRDVEIACDEAVVEGKDLALRKKYGETLLECLQEQQSRQVYSTYFFHGEKLMKARLSAIMRTEKSHDIPAYAAILLLLLDIVFCIGCLGNRFYVQYREAVRNQQLAEGETDYEAYEVPDVFSESAVERMLELEPVSENAYYEEYWAGDLYEEKEYAELPFAAEGPWQIRLRDADRYQEAAAPLLQRYLSYYFDREWAGKWNPEETGSVAILETIHSRLLAGNKENAVFSVIFRYPLFSGEELEKFPKEWREKVQFSCESGMYYAYFHWAVQISMVQDYVFELGGIANADLVMDAYCGRYDVSFEDVPVPDLCYGVPESEVGTVAAEKPFQTEIKDEKLRVRHPDGVWREVPVSLETLYSRGDDMDGVLTSLPEESFQADENKIIFAYGGGGRTPFSVVFYEEESQTYEKAVVTYNYFGGRKIFVNFPENGQEGFLIVTGERVVWQETTILFCTADGGRTWREIGYAGPDRDQGEGHSLTTGAVFINNNVGFMTIRDSGRPDVWRTQDSGQTWEPLELPAAPEYYSMAYAPIKQEGILVLYVGMEEYSEYGGTKAKYESYDEGKSWEYKGLVIRK